MQSLASFFQKSKHDPCDDETILKCASVIVVKILERLGECTTEDELDALLSLLGKSFIEKYDEFTDEFGGKKKSLENIILKLKSKEGKPFKTYMQAKLKQPICDAFEEQFNLKESTFADIFKDGKWKLGGIMFEHMVGNTFGCISIYFVILACLNDPHADRRTDLREQITYQLADIAWFIRDNDDYDGLRTLCLSNPWYETNFPQFFDPTCIYQQGHLDALGASFHIPSPLVHTKPKPFYKKFDTVDGDERRIQRLIALNKLFEKIPIALFVGKFNFVDILISFLTIKKGLTQKTYEFLSKSVAIDRLQLIHDTLKKYMPNFVKTTHITDIVIREVEGSDVTGAPSSRRKRARVSAGGRRRKTRTLKSHHRPNKTNKAKPRS